MAARFKALTLNCRGLGNPVKRRCLMCTLHKEHPDFVFLQETHFKPSGSCHLHSDRFVHQFHAPGTSKARGVAVLISKNLQVTISNSLIDPKGRYVFLTVL